MARKLILILALALMAASRPGRAEEPVDLAMMTRIRDEGLHHRMIESEMSQHTPDAMTRGHIS